MYSRPVINQLLSAGWIAERPRTNEWIGGYCWTKAGEFRRQLLKRVVDRFELNGDGQAPWSFTRECREFALASLNGCAHAAQSYWLECLEELKVPEQPETVEGLVAILMAENDFVPAE